LIGAFPRNRRLKFEVLAKVREIGVFGTLVRERVEAMTTQQKNEIVEIILNILGPRFWSGLPLVLAGL
jgi:hypothetical protein